MSLKDCKIICPHEKVYLYLHMKGLNKNNSDISIRPENYLFSANMPIGFNKEFLKLLEEEVSKDYIEFQDENKVTNFLKQLRESDELVIKIFNNGSCYKLTKILKSLYPTAEPLYSREDGHWITRIDDSYYDIGGRVSKEYVSDKEYEYLPQFEASADIPTYSNNVGVVYSKYE